MRLTTRLRAACDSMEYWAKWTALSLLGPATQDRETDPIERLKREYGRRPQL